MTDGFARREATDVPVSGFDGTARQQRHMVVSEVAAFRDLLTAGRPAHVCRFVVAIVVDAVYLHISWSWTNVLSERLEAIAPPSAYLDSSATVVGVGAIFLVLAPPYDVRPDTVESRPGKSMGALRRCTPFPEIAATGYGPPGLKMVQAHCLLGTAFAQAINIALSSYANDFRQNRQPPKYSSDDYRLSSHYP
jgi:hypothetical protein